MAEALAQLALDHLARGVPALRSMGAYRDTFRRTPHCWRLSRRQITTG
jgi:hypothetical protein